MSTRRINMQPTEVLEIISPTGTSVLKVRVASGSKGNYQVFVYPQPDSRTHLDPTRELAQMILYADPEELEQFPVYSWQGPTPIEDK